MVQQLIVHIGDPKTGTTAIQHVLRNGAYNLDSPSIFYGASQHCNKLTHMIAQKKAYTDEQIVQQWKPFSDTYNNSSASIGILSAESFTPCDPARVERIINKLFINSSADVRVVCYLRPHYDALLSRYVQHIKNGQFTGDLIEYYEVIKTSLFYAQRLKKWRNSFNNFELFVYDKEVLYDQDSVSDFFRNVIRAKNFIIHDREEKNVSLTLPELAICNYYYVALFGECKNRTRRIRNYPKPYIKIDEYIKGHGKNHTSQPKPSVPLALWKAMFKDFIADAKEVDQWSSLSSNIFEERLETAEKRTSDKVF